MNVWTSHTPNAVKKGNPFRRFINVSGYLVGTNIHITVVIASTRFPKRTIDECLLQVWLKAAPSKDSEYIFSYLNRDDAVITVLA